MDKDPTNQELQSDIADCTLRQIHYKSVKNWRHHEGMKGKDIEMKSKVPNRGTGIIVAPKEDKKIYVPKARSRN